MAFVTLLIVWMSEILVSTVEHASAALGLSQLFVGVVVVAVVGNAAEHSTAVLVASRNRMEVAIGIAIGSSTQIALFVAPLLVLLSLVIAPEPLSLAFSGVEVFLVMAATFVSLILLGPSLLLIPTMVAIASVLMLAHGLEVLVWALIYEMVGAVPPEVVILDLERLREAGKVAG